jgi:hypothetical protein
MGKWFVRSFSIFGKTSFVTWQGDRKKKGLTKGCCRDRNLMLRPEQHVEFGNGK